MKNRYALRSRVSENKIREIVRYCSAVDTTSDGIDYGFKYVNGHPKNMKNGLQTVTAFGLLASVDTGYPVLLTEMTILTALRTAATKKCMGNLEGKGLNITNCNTPEDAVLGAEVITTCTADKQYATILTDNMVGAGVHINAIGGDCPGKTELHKDILLRSDIFVEYPPQTRIEGEIQQLDNDYPVKELWQVMTGETEGRRDDPRQITLFDGVGFAIEDFSALRWLRDKIASTDKWQYLDMIADPDDPRDLFGMIERERSRMPVVK